MKYINIIYGIRFYFFVGLIGFAALCFVFGICTSIIQIINDKRKVRILTSHGLERYLKGVPSVGDGAFYAWKTKDYKINIDEHDIEKMTYKHLKKILEEKIPKHDTGEDV